MKIEINIKFEGSKKEVEFLNKLDIPIPVQITPSEVKPSEDKSEEE